MNGFHLTLSHLSAGQTAETLGIGFCTFRLWDSVGLVTPAPRNRSGQNVKRSENC